MLFHKIHLQSVGQQWQEAIFGLPSTGLETEWPVDWLVDVPRSMSPVLDPGPDDASVYDDSDSDEVIDGEEVEEEEGGDEEAIEELI